MTKEFHIAQFGAFDIESFGDSMFAKVLNLEMSTRFENYNIWLFSPSETQNSYNDNGHVFSYSQFEELNAQFKFDAIIIGGGEMLHFKPITFMRSGKELIYPGGEIWETPIYFGKSLNIPVILNCLGAPHDFNPYERKILRHNLEMTSYISVRDDYSRLRLSTALNKKIKAIPDNLWVLNRHVTIGALDEIREGLQEKYLLNLNSPYIVVQYATKYEYMELARQIEQIKVTFGINVVLLPINYCHEDLQVCDLLAEELGDSAIKINEHLQPIEIMSIIAGGEIFIGTSLHGNIIALSYGVKSIALDMYQSFVSKIDGLFLMLGLQKYIVPTPYGLLDTYKKVVRDGAYIDKVNILVDDIQKKLDIHFNTISDIIKYQNPPHTSPTDDCADQAFTFRKALIYDIESKVQQYDWSSDSNDENKYTFKYLFSKPLDLLNIEWKIFISEPLEVEIINCFVDGTEVNMYASDALDEETKRQYIADNNCSYKFLSDTKARYIEVNCRIKDADVLRYIEILRISNKNSTGHIEQLLISERTLTEEIREINSELTDKNKEIREMNSKLTDKNEKIKEISSELADKNEEIKEINRRMTNKNDELASKVLEIRERDVALRNKQGHIQMLLESDRELERIKNSRSWRCFSYFWRIRDLIIPYGSMRRLAIKITVKFAKRPVIFVKKCSPSRIKKFFYYLKKEGVSGASRRIDECILGQMIFEPIIINDILAIERKEDYERFILPLPNSNPKVSVLVPVYNQFNYTYECIKSILLNTEDINYEVVVADDCSTDTTKDISDIINNIFVVKTKGNSGFLRNCNNAAKYCKGEYIFFLNNDTQVQQGWLANALKLMEEDSTIGLIGSKLVYSDGTLQEAGGIIWSDASAWNYGRLSNPDNPEYNYVKEVDYISGAAIMIRKELWEEIGGFDERYTPAYCEDSDLAFEVREHGYKVVYQPRSVVVHFEGISNGKDINSEQKRYQSVNQIKFYDKWKMQLKESHFENGQRVFSARDRSKGKRTVLIVDHYVPHYDQDAGSKTVYQYIKLLIKHNFNIKFIGDNFFKHEPYTTELLGIGVEVLYGDYYSKNWKHWIKENGDQIDYIVLNRPHISEKYIDFVKANTNAKIIYYGHDLHYLRELREYGLTKEPNLLKSAEKWKEIELQLISKSDIAYFPSQIEVDEVLKQTPNASIKAIPGYLFDRLEGIDRNFEKRKEIIFVGGFSHGPNVDAVLWFAREIMTEIAENGLCVTIIGSNVPIEIQRFNSERFIIRGFVTDEELGDYYKRARLVIVPLRYGAGIKGKVIEAMYHGVPIITTSIGAEGITDAGDFLIIRDDAEGFAKAVVSLYNDTTVLKELSLMYPEYICEHFSETAAISVIGEDFGIK